MIDKRSATLLRGVWRGMLSRCSNEKDNSYPRYGGRGITVCPEWRDYSEFYPWAVAAGYAEGLTIERVDNEGGYCPDNCTWADRSTQNSNTRRSVRLTLFGETKSIKQWSQDPRCVVTEAALRLRIRRRNWDPLKALTTPLARKTEDITDCPKGHEYTPENTSWDGPEKKYRKCRACMRVRAHAQYARKKASRL